MDLASNIARMLESLGYDPFVAAKEQTLAGLKENIFRRLEESEYFLFIDFKREALSGPKPVTYRGSLFSHQELALAAFLDKEVIAFQEAGLEKYTGVIGILQANAFEFQDRSTLCAAIATEVAKRWKPDWRVHLMIERDANQFASERHNHPAYPEGRPVRYYHLAIRNPHIRKTAFGCHAYVNRITNRTSGLDLLIKTVEYKWRGVGFPSVIIPPMVTRELDAFFVYEDRPSELLMGCFSDSPSHMRPHLEPGQYHITFAIHSENFPDIERTFVLEFDGRAIQSLLFKAVEVR
jgi:hypothetical protein